MKDQNKAFRSLNAGLPDDVERLKAAGYYQEAIERIDEYLAEDWTDTQNSPAAKGLTRWAARCPRTRRRRAWRRCGKRCWLSGR